MLVQPVRRGCGGRHILPQQNSYPSTRRQCRHPGSPSRIAAHSCTAWPAGKKLGQPGRDLAKTDGRIHWLKERKVDLNLSRWNCTADQCEALGPFDAGRRCDESDGIYAKMKYRQWGAPAPLACRMCHALPCLRLGRARQGQRAQAGPVCFAENCRTVRRNYGGCHEIRRTVGRPGRHTL